jgi:hypothetical protein
MKKAIKGALLSGLVYPGLGQYVLGRKVIGATCMAIITACIVYIVTKIITLISVILDQMTQAVAKGSLDTFNALETTLKTVHESSLLGNAVPIVILLCWIGSIIHAYLIGKELDGAE